MTNSRLTPDDLAMEVDRSGMRVRQFLRIRYPERAPGSGRRWELDDDMVHAVRVRFGAIPAEDTEFAPLAGDSAEQRQAEGAMLQLLGRELGVILTKRRLRAANGAWAEVDGASDDPPILVEAWAHQGPPKAAQKMKVLTDALKLTWAAATVMPGARKILLFSDEEAAGRFRPERSTWSGTALSHLGVEIRVVTIPADMRAAVRRAQERQFR